MGGPRRRVPNTASREYDSLLVTDEGDIDNLPTRRVVFQPHTPAPGSVSYPGGETTRPDSPLTAMMKRGKIKATRTTRTSQKMALFPDDDETTVHGVSESADVPTSEQQVYDQVEQLPHGTVKRDTEQLRQLDRSQLPRMTAYCTAAAYRLDHLLRRLQTLKATHKTAPRRFDECLYSPYMFARPIEGHNAPPSAMLPFDGAASTATAPLPLEAPGELFVFDYGVVVLWGFTQQQEASLLRDLSGFEDEKLRKYAGSTATPDEVEREEFHFAYNKDSHPRIYNDIISLRTASNYMVKLTISHAVAQSTKLALFEGLVDDTIDSTKHIPREMARTGNSLMSRTAISRKIGQLFIMRINVNLVSNVLDTPEIFWSEPALQPLYDAIKGYLEISQRVDLLNQRVTVISDLLDMLREHLNSRHGEQLEWIVIYLIALEIVIGIITISIELFGGRGLFRSDS